MALLGQIFYGLEGHHVLGIPADPIRSHFRQPFPGHQAGSGDAAVPGKGNRVTAAVDIDRHRRETVYLDELGHVPGRGLAAQRHGQGVGQDQEDQGQPGGQPFGPVFLLEGVQAGCQPHGKGRQTGKGVGGVFGGHTFKEEPGHSNPQEEKPLAVIQTLPENMAAETDSQGFSVFFPEPGQAQAPGETAYEENQEIVPPGIVPGMLGYRGPEDVVDPDEPFQEGAAVELDHGTIPQGGNGQGEKETPAQLHVEQGMAVPVPQQIRQDDQTGEHQADGPFGQDGETRQEIGSVIEPGPLPGPGHIEQHQGTVHEYKKRHVGDYRLGQIEIFHRGGHDQAAEETGSPIVQFLGKPVGLEDPDGAEDRGKETGRKGCFPEEPEGCQKLSVEQPGFVIPVVSIDPG